MFDAVNELSKTYKVTFTCYVDDLCFSGDVIPKKMIYEVKRLIQKQDLRSHKQKFYGEKRFKVITGVGILDRQTKVPNKRHKKIYDRILHSHESQNLVEKKQLVTELLGSVSEASQLDPKIENFRKSLIAVNRKLNN